MDVRRDLLLIFKEAVNNAARHSRSARVWRSICASKGSRLLLTWSLITELGFNPSLKRAMGKAVMSMMRRAGGFKGVLEINSRSGSGNNRQAHSSPCDDFPLNLGILVKFVALVAAFALPTVATAHNWAHTTLFDGSCLEPVPADDGPIVGQDRTQLDLIPGTPRDEFGVSFVGVSGVAAHQSCPVARRQPRSGPPRLRTTSSTLRRSRSSSGRHGRAGPAPGLGPFSNSPPPSRSRR